jgi:hypothetical protein
MLATQTASRALTLLLRVMGASSLLALIFVAAPESWMAAIHAELDMGPLPTEPVVGYLARSTSAFYAITGGLFLVISRDLARHRAVLSYLGWAMALFGVVLLAVDWLEGMPASWTLWEGPFVVLFGAALLWLTAHIDGEQTPTGP